MKSTKIFGSILFVCVLLFGKAAFAQTFTDQTAGLEKTSNGKTIKAWYTAWEQRDWNLMTQILADGFTFTSPLDDHLKIDVVKERCWPNAGNFKSIDVKQVIMNGDKVIVIANGYSMEGKFFRNCDYFQLKNGKITAYECFFGPGINFPNNTGK